MALNRLPVYESRNAAQYDGLNSGDLANEITDFTVDSESNGQLTFTSGGQQYTVGRDGYVAWYQGAVTDVFQNEDDFRDTYASVQADMNHVHDITTGTGRAAPAA